VKLECAPFSALLSATPFGLVRVVIDRTNDYAYGELCQPSEQSAPLSENASELQLASIFSRRSAARVKANYIPRLPRVLGDSSELLHAC